MEQDECDLLFVSHLFLTLTFRIETEDGKGIETWIHTKLESSHRKSAFEFCQIDTETVIEMSIRTSRFEAKCVSKQTLTQRCESRSDIQKRSWIRRKKWEKINWNSSFSVDLRHSHITSLSWSSSLGNKSMTHKIKIIDDTDEMGPSEGQRNETKNQWAYNSFTSEYRCEFICVANRSKHKQFCFCIRDVDEMSKTVEIADVNCATMTKAIGPWW